MMRVIGLFALALVFALGLSGGAEASCLRKGGDKGALKEAELRPETNDSVTLLYWLEGVSVCMIRVPIPDGYEMIDTSISGQPVWGRGRGADERPTAFGSLRRCAGRDPRHPLAPRSASSIGAASDGCGSLLNPLALIRSGGALACRRREARLLTFEQLPMSPGSLQDDGFAVGQVTVCTRGGQGQTQDRPLKSRIRDFGHQ
jgi:hypothetical protein